MNVNELDLSELDVREDLIEGNRVPDRCARPIESDNDSGPHYVRFVPDAPAWPVRVDMLNEPDRLPDGVGPAPPQAIRHGCVLAEVDNFQEDGVYAVRADSELVQALGLPALPWIERVKVRYDREDIPLYPLLSAHTLIPCAAVTEQDSWWRDLSFGMVAVPGAVVHPGDTWVRTSPATAWEAQALGVRPGADIHLIMMKFTVECASQQQPAHRFPGGLVIKLPAGRVTLESPLPPHVRDCRTSSHG